MSLYLKEWLWASINAITNTCWHTDTSILVVGHTGQDMRQISADFVQTCCQVWLAQSTLPDVQISHLEPALYAGVTLWSSFQRSPIYKGAGFRIMNSKQIVHMVLFCTPDHGGQQFLSNFRSERVEKVPEDLCFSYAIGGKAMQPQEWFASMDLPQDKSGLVSTDDHLDNWLLCPPKGQVNWNTFTPLFHILTLWLTGNSEKSSLTLKQVTQLKSMRLDSLRILTTSSPQCYYNQIQQDPTGATGQKTGIADIEEDPPGLRVLFPGSHASPHAGQLGWHKVMPLSLPCV